MAAQRTRSSRRFALPQPLRQEMLEAFHDDVIGGGHRGLEKTIKKFLYVYEAVSNNVDILEIKNHINSI